MIRQMRRLSWALILVAGCASSEPPPRSSYEPGPKEPPPAPAATPQAAPTSGPSAAKETRDLEPYNGKRITLSGTFESDRAIHGIVRLHSGLRVWLPHFDLVMRGDDWLKYVGKPCTVSGVLHTYVKDIDGHRQPRLDEIEFSGTP
jgi:hypothetical protein